MQLKKHYRSAACLFGMSMLVVTASAQRLVYSINNNWLFIKDTTTVSVHPPVTGKWQTVSFPHCWNRDDVMDDEPGYFRGAGWYRKKLAIRSYQSSKQYSLFFEGANQVTEVYINGTLLGSHTGGYTGFRFIIPGSLIKDGGSVDLLVKVNNRYDPAIPPLTADFTFFGGIYRDAWLIATPSTHFLLNENGTDEWFIKTPVVSREKATLRINGALRNDGRQPQRLIIKSVIHDRERQQVSRVKDESTIAPGDTYRFEQELPAVSSPHLWSPADPYRYMVTTSLIDATTGKVLDELTTPTGFRWFSFDADKGFFLNGEHLSLTGASRHQDYAFKGNAVPDRLAIADLVWLKKMGANFLRVAHYPQDPSVLRACDSLGLLASVEIPIVNEITPSDTFTANCEQMLREMIDQHFNHPSVVIWCYMNEVLLRPHFNEDKSRQQEYFKQIRQLAAKLDSICRVKDPSRYTMIANHGDFDRYKSTGLIDVPMIVGWNLYSGWYGGKLENFPAFLDRHHREFPDKPMVVSEYGADADPRIRSNEPVRFDKSVEYSLGFHQYYLREMQQRAFVVASMIWNLADFNSETREETMPHINNKGLLTWDRKPKDLYYYYQARLSTTPMLRFMSAYWNKRIAQKDSLGVVVPQKMQVATNCAAATLFINGKKLETVEPNEGIATWNVSFRDGKNKLKVVAANGKQLLSDTCTIDVQVQPYRLADVSTPFPELHILAGAKRMYIDPATGTCWQPAIPYRAGNWGYSGGDPYLLKGNTRLPYGTDRNITGTTNDPVYQTRLEGIQSFRFDVPRGHYQLTLHFAELLGAPGKTLIYNLDQVQGETRTTSRVFSIRVNGKMWIEHLDIARTVGDYASLKKMLELELTGNEGIFIEFIPEKGLPVLNAIEFKKTR